jgi:hypothetical protein
MKDLEDLLGDAFTSRHAQVDENTFLTTLDRNVEMLEDRPWIDVALVYSRDAGRCSP